MRHSRDVQRVIDMSGFALSFPFRLWLRSLNVTARAVGKGTSWLVRLNRDATDAIEQVVAAEEAEAFEVESQIARVAESSQGVRVP